MKSLGIFITSDRFPDYAVSLVRAAKDSGLMVYIHFSGSGVRLVRRAEFNQLAAWGRISVCQESAALFDVDDLTENDQPCLLVPPHQMGRIIQMCDRYVFM
jgi:hypothetical protein